MVTVAFLPPNGPLSQTELYILTDSDSKYEPSNLSRFRIILYALIGHELKTLSSVSIQNGKKTLYDSPLFTNDPPLSYWHIPFLDKTELYPNSALSNLPPDSYTVEAIKSLSFYIQARMGPAQFVVTLEGLDKNNVSLGIDTYRWGQNLIDYVKLKTEIEEGRRRTRRYIKYLLAPNVAYDYTDDDKNVQDKPDTNVALNSLLAYENNFVNHIKRAIQSILPDHDLDVIGSIDKLKASFGSDPESLAKVLELEKVILTNQKDDTSQKLNTIIDTMKNSMKDKESINLLNSIKDLVNNPPHEQLDSVVLDLKKLLSSDVNALAKLGAIEDKLKNPATITITDPQIVTKLVQLVDGEGAMSKKLDALITMVSNLNYNKNNNNNDNMPETPTAMFGIQKTRTLLSSNHNLCSKTWNGFCLSPINPGDVKINMTATGIIYAECTELLVYDDYLITETDVQSTNNVPYDELAIEPGFRIRIWKSRPLFTSKVRIYGTCIPPITLLSSPM